MDKIYIIKEIKRYLGFTKDCQLARHLGITPQTFSNWKSRNSYNIKLIYTKCKVFNYEWLLTGRKPMLKKEYTANDRALSFTEEADCFFSPTNTNCIPLYTLDPPFRLKDILTKDSTHATVSDFIKIPDLADCNGATYVNENFILPFLKTGDILIFKSVSVKDIFEGGLYLIEFNKSDDSFQLFLGQVQKSETGKRFVKLSRPDDTLISLDIPINKICAIALIRGSVRLF